MNLPFLCYAALLAIFIVANSERDLGVETVQEVAIRATD